MGKVKWLDDKFVNALDSKMTLLLALWALDKVVMTTLFFVFR